MTVYLLIEQWWDNTEVHGVYDSVRKAKAAARTVWRTNRKEPLRWSNRGYFGESKPWHAQSFTIEPMVLNDRVRV